MQQLECNNYMLRRGNKRVSIKEDDMFVHKVATIFQESDGHFSSIALVDKAHYEVCGDSIELPGAQAARFSFTRPLPTAASGSASALRASAAARASAAKALQSRHEDTGLDEVKCQIEEVVLASQGLGEVLEKINKLVDSVGTDCRTLLYLTSAQVDAVKHAFACIICTNPVKDPYVSTCCNSIIGCAVCIDRLQQTTTSCPKCRAEHFYPHKLGGLAEAMSALGDLLE
ncbi:uncharacterized protein LOC134066586 [Sardina pilchardus]|uniref:uncharacterized protein LOC134066586 n=1 Tax=Sardina pilchardus TaxID=27697 RepID=UPI002E1268FE